MPSIGAFVKLAFCEHPGPSASGTSGVRTLLHDEGDEKGMGLALNAVFGIVSAVLRPTIKVLYMFGYAKDAILQVGGIDYGVAS